MFRVAVEVERRVLTELQYCEPELVQMDLKEVRSVFSDIRLYCDVYCFPNKHKRRLLFLAGTIPVLYQGAQYNFPVCLWLHQTHPATRPRCCVCPSAAMAINPHCCYVDTNGNVLLPRLHNWTRDRASLVLLMSEMKRAFEKDTPLYSRPLPLQQTSPPADVGRPHNSSFGPSPGLSHSPSRDTSPSPGLSHSPSRDSSPIPGGLKGTAHKRSYCEDLKGIDFSPNRCSQPANQTWSPAPSDLTDVVSALTTLHLSPSGQSEQRNQTSSQSQRSPNHKPASKLDCEEELKRQMAELSPHKLQMFIQLLHGRENSAEGQGYSTCELLEAVHLNEDLPSAKRFLHHICPVCQEEQSFSKMLLMTHCCCSLCQSCFKSWFSSVIKEKRVDQFVCPLCGKPDFRQNPDQVLDYFSLLDTQIRHFLSAELHDLFQRKLRDHALSHMTHFCWCSHCSFGVLHESRSLRMDCPSCSKSTCSRCRSPWSEEHQGASCGDLRVRNQTRTGSQFNCIECPVCGELFSGSRGGCLHFSCLRCGTDFCGGCSQRFAHGQTCQFDVSCSSKGLHAHHPRDCVYHLRDWSLPRLHLLLQFYRLSPADIETANQSTGPAPSTGLCPVLELSEHSEMPCGKPSPPGLYRGYCRAHYVERVVQLLNAVGADPLMLFSLEEAEAELRRWNLPLPPRRIPSRERAAVPHPPHPGRDAETSPQESTQNQVYGNSLDQSFCSTRPWTKPGLDEV